MSTLRESWQQAVENRCRLDALLDATVDGIVTIDTAGTILTFNRAAGRIFGHEAGAVLGKPVNMLMPPPYRDEHDGYLSAYLETGVARIIGIGREVEGLRKDGSTFPLELAVSEVRLQNGEVQFIGLLRDITARRELEAQSARQEKLAAVGQLAAGVAHEIGNPLASISSVVQNLQRKNQDDRVAQKLELIGTHIDRITHIVRQLVDFARPPRQEWRQVSIPRTLAKVLEIARYDPRARGVQIHLEIDPELPEIEGMEDQLSQVFLNLVLNSLDALAASSRGSDHRVWIDVAAHERRGTPGVEVSVTDNGPGIPTDIQRRVFEPFFTTKQVGKGTGLGLAVSFRIIEQHGGSIYVDGGYADGARFVIELPLDRRQSQQEEEERDEPRAGRR